MGTAKHLSEHPSLLPEILIFKFESVHRTEALAIVLDNLAGATQQKMIVFNCVKTQFSFSVKQLNVSRSAPANRLAGAASVVAAYPHAPADSYTKPPLSKTVQ